MIRLADSVEFIELQMEGSISGGNETTTSGMLTKGQNIDNCVPFISYYCGNDAVDGQFPDIWFTDEGGPAINAQRSDYNSYDMYIKGYVVEFDPEKVKVYQGELPTTVNYNSETNVTASGTFDKGATAMVFYHRVTGWSNDTYIDQFLVRGQVVSDGTISFRKQVNVSTTCYGHYYLFESLDDDFSVNHWSGTFTGNTSYETGVYDWHNTFLITSYCSTVNTTGTDFSCMRSYLWGNSRVGVNRQSNSGTMYFNTQKIEFDNDATASGTRYCPKITSYHSLNTTTTEREITFEENHIQQSDGLTIISAQNPTRAAYTNNTDQGGAFHAVWLTSSGTKYKIKRAEAVQYSYPTYYLVDWYGGQVPQYPDLGTNPAPIASGISPVKSVENISTNIPEHVSVVHLTKGQNVNNCIVFGTGHADKTSSYNQVYAHEFMAYFRGNELYLERGNEGNRHYTELSVVEFYPEQVKVQQGTFIIGMNATSTTVTIEEIDTTKTFLVFGHFYGDGNDEWCYHLCRGRITNSTTLTFSRGVSHTYPIMGTWFIAEDLGDNWYVRHWNSSTTASNRLTPQWDQHYSPYNTFNLMSSEIHVVIDDPDEATWQTYYQSPLSPGRAEKVGSSYNNTVNIQVINFLDEEKARVYYTSKYLTGTSSSATYDLSSALTTNSGTVSTVWNNLNGISRVSSTSNNANSHAFHRIQYFPDTNQITMSRRYSGVSDTSGGSIYMVDWQGHNVSSGEEDYGTLGHFIKSIEYFNYVGSSRRISFTATKSQNLDNCLPIATWHQGEDSGSDPERFFWAFWMRPEVSVIEAGNYWGANNPGVDMDMALIEFDPNQVRVQHGGAHIHSGSTTDTVTIEEVDTSKAFIQVYMFPTDGVGSNYGAVFTRAKFNSSTELYFERYNSTSNVHLTWFVVECLQDQWEVDHSESINTNATYYDHNFSNVTPLDKTVSVASYSSWYTSDDPDHQFYRMYPSYDQRGVYRIRINRQASGYNVSWNVSKIAFAEDSGVTVIPIHYYFSTTETTKTYSLGRTVNPNKTILWNGLSFNTMRLNSTSTTATQRGFIKVEIEDSETLRVTRCSDTYSVEGWGHIYVVEFDIPTHKVSGVVREKGNFVSRNLNLHNTNTGDLLSTTTSSGTDGSYDLVTSYSGSSYVVCFDNPEGTVYNGLIETDVYPELVPGVFPFEEE